MNRIPSIALVLCLSCSSAATTQNDAGRGDAAPPIDAATLTCPTGTRLSDDKTFCEGVLTVSRSSVQIMPVRDHHTTYVHATKVGTFLYVFAGTDAWKSVHDDVLRAKIADDGSLGPFEVVSKLPAVRAGHCMIVAGGRVTLFGGTNGSTMMSSSVTATLSADDGTIGAWTSGPDLPEGVMHETCDRSGDWVYAIGGRGGGGSTHMAARAKIAGDGTIGAFEKLADLAPDRSHHQSFVMHDRLYLVGGLTGDPVGNKQINRKDIVFAPIASDGSLGDWQMAGELPKPLSITGATIYGEAVYMLGGYEGGAAYLDGIQRLTFNPDGTLASHTVVGKLLTARGHVHQQPMYKTFMYSVGGLDSTGKSLGVVDVLRFDG